MATNPRLLTRTRFVLAALEATYGVDAAPSAGTNAILCKSSLSITPMESTQVKRDLIVPYLGDLGAVLADTYVKIDFEVELAGSGAAGTAPGMDPLLQACGMSATITPNGNVTYEPVSSNFSSSTLYFYGQTDQGTAVLHKITGARGDFELDLQVGQIPTVKFTMMGLYNAPTEIAAPTGVGFGKFIKPVISSATTTTPVSIFGLPNVALSKLQLKCGNKTDFMNLIGDQYILLSDRQTSGQFDFGAVTPDIHDFFASAINGVVTPASISHGTVAGNTVTVNMPKLQGLNPAYSDSKGVQMFQIPFIAQPNVGNDEFNLVFA